MSVSVSVHLRTLLFHGLVDRLPCDSGAAGNAPKVSFVNTNGAVSLNSADSVYTSTFSSSAACHLSGDGLHQNRLP